MQFFGDENAEIFQTQRMLFFGPFGPFGPFVQKLYPFKDKKGNAKLEKCAKLHFSRIQSLLGLVFLTDLPKLDNIDAKYAI